LEQATVLADFEQGLSMRYPQGQSRTCYQECSCHLKIKYMN